MELQIKRQRNYGQANKLVWRYSIISNKTPLNVKSQQNLNISEILFQIVRTSNRLLVAAKYRLKRIPRKYNFKRRMIGKPKKR